MPAIFLPEGLLILLGFSAVFSLLYPSFTPWGILPFNGLYGEAPPDGGVPLQGFWPVYERVGISLVEIYERVEKSVIFGL